MNIRVAAAQIPVTRDIEANLKAIHRAMDFAVAEKAEVLLTPEGSLSGYTWEFEPRLAETALADVTGPARVIDGNTLEIQGQRIRLRRRRICRAYAGFAAFCVFTLYSPDRLMIEALWLRLSKPRCHRIALPRRNMLARTSRGCNTIHRCLVSVRAGEAASVCEPPHGGSKSG